MKLDELFGIKRLRMFKQQDYSSFILNLSNFKDDLGYFIFDLQYRSSFITEHFSACKRQDRKLNNR